MNDQFVRRFLDRLSPVSGTIRAIYVFGSRAKGTHRPDSDYDLLLVVTEAFTPHDKSLLYDIVIDLLLDTGRLASLKIFKEPEFNRLMALNTPFMRHVLTEGVKVG